MAVVGDSLFEDLNKSRQEAWDRDFAAAGRGAREEVIAAKATEKKKRDTAEAKEKHDTYYRLEAKRIANNNDADRLTLKERIDAQHKARAEEDDSFKAHLEATADRKRKVHMTNYPRGYIKSPGQIEKGTIPTAYIPKHTYITDSAACRILVALGKEDSKTLRRFAKRHPEHRDTIETALAIENPRYVREGAKKPMDTRDDPNGEDVCG